MLTAYGQQVLPLDMYFESGGLASFGVLPAPLTLAKLCSRRTNYTSFRSERFSEQICRLREMYVLIRFQDTAHAKRVTKAHKRCSDQSLSELRESFSRCCGYRDWHELANSRHRGVAHNQAQLSRAKLVCFATNVSALCGVASAEVLDQVFRSRLLPKWPSFDEQLRLQGEVFRKYEIKLNDASAYGRQYYDQHSAGIFTAQNERMEGGIRGWIQGSTRSLRAVSDLGPELPKSQSRFYIPPRFYLPYAWFKVDDQEVIIDRDYFPIFTRFANGKTQRLHSTHTAGVQDYVYLWPNGIKWSDPEIYQEIWSIYERFGLQGLPSTLALIPRLLLRPGRSMRDVIS